jgi:hypothetical protein
MDGHGGSVRMSRNIHFWLLLVSSSGLLITGRHDCRADESILNAENKRTALKLPVADVARPAKPGSHPLEPLIQTAVDTLKHIHSDVRDYSCLVVRQERVNGLLSPHEFIIAKVRNEQRENGRVVTPFSVYLKFAKPDRVKGREVLFVNGRNDGDMFARRGGTRFAFVTTRLKPTSELAMKDNRYPITEFGIENLVVRLLQAAKQDLATDCDVTYLKGAKISERPCRGIVVTHEKRPAEPRFHQVRIFIDDEHNVPIHYEAFDWPEQAGGEPQLMERYTYTKLKFNNGFTDWDFDPDNPDYKVK